MHDYPKVGVLAFARRGAVRRGQGVQLRGRTLRFFHTDDLPQGIETAPQQLLAIKGRLAYQQLVEQHAQAVDVRPRINVQPAHLRLLGADVSRRADELLELREHRLVRQLLLRGLGDAEINHLRHRFAVVQRDENVRGLDVAMDDALLVRVLDRLADFDKEIEPFFGWKLVLIAVLGDLDPPDQFHDEVGPARAHTARFPLIRPSGTLSPSGGEGARRADEGESRGMGAGRPYFVMELVRGIKITEYCDQNQLPTKERLDLFIKVCQAIQHAHQKGIIHRDIKPSNILVTLHDGEPVPKVIDFGIAKATQQELTDKTVFTQFQQFIGTPAYISPEQAEMSGLDIDTRADIYSPGVLLYALLVGQTPFDAKAMMKGGLDALRQIIREREPLLPSTKLNTLQGDARTTAGKRRQTDVGKLVHQLQGDLDWIVMKCLEKDRTRRYDTANGLASDIQRHLNDETVLARPPSAAYRFQKLVRRNKLAFAAVGAVACALVLGVVVSAWQAVRATSAEQAQRTLAELARADRDRAGRAEGDARIQTGIARDALATLRRKAYAA